MSGFACLRLWTRSRVLFWLYGSVLVPLSDPMASMRKRTMGLPVGPPQLQLSSKGEKSSVMKLLKPLGCPSTVGWSPR